MDSLEVKKIWDDAKSHLQETLIESDFAWLNHLYPTGYANGIFSVITDMQFAITVIRKNCLAQVQDAIRQVTGNEVDFQISLDKESVTKIKAERKKLEQKLAKVNSSKDTVDEQPDVKLQSNINLNLKFKFENFVVGENNKNACAIAKLVAKNPAEKYNPSV